MEPQSIFSQVRSAVDSHKTEHTEKYEGKNYNQYEHILYADKSYDGDGDDLNKDNITRIATDMFVGDMDVDIKNALISTDDADARWYTEIMRSIFVNKYAEKGHLTEEINNSANYISKYGGVFLKRVPQDGIDTIVAPQLRNLIFDLTSATGGRIIETNTYKPSEFYEQAKSAGWKGKPEDIIRECLYNNKGERAKVNGKLVDEVIVREVHCLAPRSTVTGDKEDTELVPQVHIFAMSDCEDTPAYGKEMVLRAFENKGKPFYKFASLFAYDGVTLSDGIPHLMKHEQKLIDEYKRKELELIASNGLEFYYADPTQPGYDPKYIDGNKIKNRAIIPFEIKAVSLSNGQSQLFNSQGEQIRQQARDKTYTSDPYRGGDLPANTPLGIVDWKKEDEGGVKQTCKERFEALWEDAIKDWALPAIDKMMTSEEVQNYRIDGDFADRLNERIAGLATKKAISDKRIPNDEAVVSQYFDTALEEIQNDEKIKIKNLKEIKKKALDSVQVHFNNEKRNLQKELASLAYLANAYGPDNPVTQALLAQKAEKIGLPQSGLVGSTSANPSSKPIQEEDQTRKQEVTQT